METASSLIVVPSRRKLNRGILAEAKAFREFLDQRLVGQEEAKDQIVEILKVIRNPVRDPDSMIASFIMAGPSTVGKTRLFKLLVEWVNGDKKHMMFFSGTDYEERHQLQNLLGSPHGYIGFEKDEDVKAKLQPGQDDMSALLSEHNMNNTLIGAKADGVIFILFDEWEKFHSAFNRFMLRPLREGHGKLNNGAKVSFRRVVCGFTTNLGATELEKTVRGFGFGAGNAAAAVDTKAVRQIVVDEMNKFVPQEFRNRINHIVYFRGLRGDESLKLVDVEIEEVQRRIARLPNNQSFTFKLDEAAKRFLLKDTDPVPGDDTKNRVPKLLDRIKKHLELPLGELVMLKEIQPGDDVDVTYEEGCDELSFSKFDLGADLKEHLKTSEKPTTVAIDGQKMSELGAEKSAQRAKKTSKAKVEGKTEGTTARAERKNSNKKRRSRKVIMQEFCVKCRYETLEDLLQGRDDVEHYLEKASRDFDLDVVQEVLNRRTGYLEYVVEAPVECMLWLKHKLRKTDVMIVGGRL